MLLPTLAAQRRRIEGGAPDIGSGYGQVQQQGQRQGQKPRPSKRGLNGAPSWFVEGWAGKRKD